VGGVPGAAGSGADAGGTAGQDGSADAADAGGPAGSDGAAGAGGAVGADAAAGADGAAGADASAGADGAADAAASVDADASTDADASADADGGGACPAASAVYETLTNGGFEAPAVGTASYLNIAPCAEPAAFGWAITTNNVDLVSNGVLGTTSTAFEGTQAVDLVGVGSTGGIKQSFRTTAGTTYTLGFAYANNAVSTTTASALVTLKSSAGNVLLTQTITHSTSTRSAADWKTLSMSFTAADGITTLTFETTVGGGNGGIVIDAVTVTP
jgi:hypothetical protein